MRRPLAQVWRGAAAVAVAAAAVGGCALGERPTMAEAPTVVGQMTGDAAIDAVLERLDRVEAAVFGAEYSAVQNMGGATSAVRVAQTAPTRSSVTIGDVRYLVDGTDTRTCDITTGACAPGIDAQKISNTGLQTPDLVFDGLAKRLRLDASARVGTSTASSETIAGQLATCADVTLTRGTVRYCVLDSGVIALYAGGDFRLDLTVYSPTPDELQFQTMTSSGAGGGG
jgi:hypothetical protein